MKKMNKKGFTLIELLAVIVILGLLMAIAIPSVTRYITQSRKKTLVNTISNYIQAVTTDVNNMDYTFTGANTIYAVPISCIAVERGGSNPFGTWTDFNNSSWAYVLVQYDAASSSYNYGFTFKDTAGYGMYPTTSEKLDAKGDNITTTIGSSLASKYDGFKQTESVVSGETVYNYTTTDKLAAASNWNGFSGVTDSSTTFHVLKPATAGDRVNSCTIVEK